MYTRGESLGARAEDYIRKKMAGKGEQSCSPCLIKEHKIYLFEVQWYMNNVLGLIDINQALASVLGTLDPLSLFLWQEMGQCDLICI